MGALSRACDAEPMRLLLVEDEVRLASALQRGLTDDGFTVEVAGDGALGLDLARHGDFDAVVLDVMLPGLSGYDVRPPAARGAELGAGVDALGQGR